MQNSAPRRRDYRKPGGKPVKPVYQVERIDRPDDPEHRKRQIQPRRDPRSKRVEPNVAPEEREHRNSHLPKELHGWP